MRTSRPILLGPFDEPLNDGFPVLSVADWRLLDAQWAHRGCWAVQLPVALGAGVPVGLRGLRGWALGFALRVGGPPGWPSSPFSVGVPALYPVGLSVSVNWQWWPRPAALLGGPWGLRSWRKAAVAALAAARRAAAAALSGELLPVALVRLCRV